MQPINYSLNYDYIIVGAGITGIVLAERLSSIGKKILLIDKRDHIGGNCYDYMSKGILVQKYGPHIFHTNSKEVYEYLLNFTQFIPYKHRVISFHSGDYFPIPINKTTINKFYKTNLKTEEEVKRFLEPKKIKINEIKNSRDVVISKLGEELYESFVKHYTKKQWDKYPEELDKSILERIPIRYDDNPHYFNDEYQGLPNQGFTKMFEKMLSSKNIFILLNANFKNIENELKYKNLIFTGRIDSFFDYKYNKLGFRGIKFIFEDIEKQSYQPNTVVNYPSSEFEFSRVTEYKKFYNIQSKNTIISKEIFNWEGEAAYPVLNEENKKILERYNEKSFELTNVIFAGRLGEFKYYDMDKAVLNALGIFNKIKYNNV